MLYQESKGRAESSKATLDTLKASVCPMPHAQPDDLVNPLDALIQNDARKDALRRDPEYKAYIQSLLSAGYFRGELEGSQLWNTLEDKALEVYLQTRNEEYVRHIHGPAPDRL